MGNAKDFQNKSLQLLVEESQTYPSKVFDAKSSKNDHQVFLHQSVTLLAFKNKATVNATLAPDVLQPKLFFGIVPEDLPLFIGAVIGASLILAISVLVFAVWKCCCRMTILSKKKQYWLHPEENSSAKRKYKLPVVQSNSVVFLGLKPTQAFDYKRKRSSENCIITKFTSGSMNEAFETTAFGDPLQYTMSGPCPEIVVSAAEKHPTEGYETLPGHLCPNNTHNQPCSVISISPVLDNKTVCTKPCGLVTNEVNIPDITIHQDSPAIFHRNVYSGTFDQHSLYSYDSQIGSEIDLKKYSFTWSDYSLRKSSTSDCYYDLFQKASFCKKRKNRMRSDIAAAIALNRSQSPQLNKDTELLVENTVEVVSDERTTL